ncbi:aspartate aminotransferase [Oxobacter pfennigii]|uniref:Aminotransferase n=1 Tax=Oxobacter pfennigii TaxID=36849 RepID=A0A0P8YST9_9CLOT|nr:pyridoxal phosphate-dependent aminotransferase [Oxobacter pfennigii]KPU42743.1 aspartate aminotransferase [Oxobacter pfennigii]
MNYISRIALNLKSSSIRNMYNMANTMENVVSFAIGEPDFTTAANIIEASNKALMDGQTHYTTNAGILPLRQAIANKLRNKNNVNVKPDDVIITAGGMEALMLCMMTILDPGDEVIVTDPFWSNHPSQIIMCGAIPKFVKVYEEDGFVYNPDNIKNAINKNTKALLINSPSNPTGGVADEEVLKEIAKIAIENDLIVISDEVYQHLVYDDAKFMSIAAFPGMKERTVIIDSFSKTYAMTGWRIGYAAGASQIIQYMTKLQENVVSCVNTPSQYAAIEALEGPQDYLHYMLSKYTERRKLVVEGINSIDRLSCIKPKGAFYAFMNIKETHLSSEEFAVTLLKNKGVVVVPGSGFGEAGEGYVRVSYATSEENIIEGLKRIKSFVECL